MNPRYSIVALVALLALSAQAQQSPPTAASGASAKPAIDPRGTPIFDVSVTGNNGNGEGPIEVPPFDPQHPSVPDAPTPNGDYNDPGLGLPQIPTYSLEGGYAATADGNGVNSGGGIGAVVMIEGGRTGIMLGGQVAGTQGGVFAYAQGDLKARFRFPVDKNHIIWGGLGLDVNGRGAVDPKSQSYLTAQLPVAFIGTMFNVGGNCVIHLFAKAAFGIFDNQGQSGSHWGANWDNFAKPAVGAEAMAACGTVLVQADYQHVFDFGPGGDTDRAKLNFSQVFPVKPDGSIQVGYFVRGEYEHEGAVSGIPSGEPGGDPRNIGSLFTGLEVRFGTSGKTQ